MIDDVIFVDGASGGRRVRLGEYLEAAAEQRASAAEYEWIKQLRHIDVDGQPFRRRFTMRGDSLWWFAELFLHKQQVLLNVFRTIAAFDTLLAREAPRLIRFEHAGSIVRMLGPLFADKHGIRCEGRAGVGTGALRKLRLDLRARTLTLAAQLSRMRDTSPPSRSAPATVAAFIHRAFWQSTGAEGSAESYIGPVLTELEARLADRIAYIGVGPSENFRARRWWHPVVHQSGRDGAVIPIESFAPRTALHDSLQIWHDRHRFQRALMDSAQLRRHSTIAGYDCWPIVREELTGIAFLQWPWSARAMDEAGAALDALRPEVVVTYAEAGGWGRALILEARRRGIPSVGLQHGFIYHSWLNYRHEDDEMRPDVNNPADRGFPLPDRTLVFDDYARTHLEGSGHFPTDSVVVAGSPRLDALVRSVRQLSPSDIAAARALAGAAASHNLVLFVAKYSQSKSVLMALIDAVARLDGVHLAIKTHPAETPDVYSPLVEGRTNITVLPANAPLAPLLGASKVVVTVNSTVALDAGVVGIPALVIGLPNNLSPFVAAGAMAGAATPADIEPVLRRILYDEGFRLQIERARADYLQRFAIRSDGQAAARSADAVLALADHHSFGSAQRKDQ